MELLEKSKFSKYVMLLAREAEKIIHIEYIGTLDYCA